MDVVEQIKERLDIVEVIGRSVHLQKAGRNLKGLCPFHTEKTPSFFVFPDSQRWRCFGCGRGGDLFTFVMEHEGMDFRSTLEELGRRAGVEIRPRTPEQVQAEAENERLKAAHEAAADYYHRLLLSAPQADFARGYLQRRGFKAETLAGFRLGYSLDDWNALRTALMGQGFTVPELIQAGLLVEKDGGGTYDRFRNRVMLPICDRRGQVIAFGSRTLSDEGPKYMNSPQTPLFDKSQVLFGMDKAGQAIRQREAAIIVEGYMDVMILHQEGCTNVVAPMGTALTESHLKQIQRLTQRFILALDPDAAGIHATLRGLEVARETLERKGQAIFDPRGLVGYQGRLNADIRVVSLPDGLDPDELILQDRARWDALLGGSQPIIRFYFQELLKQVDAREPRGKAQIVDTMLPLLQDLADGVEREAYVREIAGQLGLDERGLQDRLRTREKATAIRQQAAVAKSGHTLSNASLEAHILAILMHYPELLEQVDSELAAMELERVQDEDFSPHYRLIWAAWQDMLAHPEKELEELLPQPLFEEVQSWGSTLSGEASLEQWERDLARTLLRLRESHLREELRQLSDLIREAQAEGDTDALQQLSVAFQARHETLRRIQTALSKRT